MLLEGGNTRAPVVQDNIQMRSSTLITTPALRLLWWMNLLNARADVCAVIGKTELKVMGIHFFLETTFNILVHGDGDVYIPPGHAGIDPSTIANKIWDVCECTPYAEYIPPALVPPTAIELNLKKVAADFNRRGITCRYEPLAKKIRLAQGVIIDSRAHIYRPSTMRMSNKYLWEIMKVAKDGVATKRRKTST